MPRASKVVVLGSINVDLLVRTPRLPQAGETVSGTGLTRQLGGKGANQAVAAARAGVRSVMLGAVGDDADGAAMKAALAGYGVDTGEVRVVPRATGCAVVATSPEDNQIVVIAGANGHVDAAQATGIALDRGDVCLAQMETPAAATAALFGRARAAGALTLLNAAPASAEALQLLPLCDMLIVNPGELGLLCAARAVAVDNDGELLGARAALGLAGQQGLIVTLGAKGAAIVLNHGVSRIAGQPASVVDTTGAGDCFCGYLAAGLARGEPLDQAALHANAAAALSVGSLGAAASVPDRATTLRNLSPLPA